MFTVNEKSILIIGLPGSGKTTFSQQLIKSVESKYSIEWINADQVRKKHQDWDFSLAGRQRQTERMKNLKDSSSADIVVCDFVCPKEQYRKLFDPTILIWMNTIEQGRFQDTNEMFEIPNSYTYRIDNWTENDKILEKIVNSLQSLK